MFNMDSFGQDCPVNWEEIAAYLNEKIEGIDETDSENRDAIDNVWESYWAAYHSGELPADAPAPIVEE